MPGNNFLQNQVKAGVYRALDRRLLPNLRHLDPASCICWRATIPATGTRCHSSTVYLANANRAADALGATPIRQDPLIYPDAAMLSRLRLNQALSADFMRPQSREFARFRNDAD